MDQDLVVRVQRGDRRAFEALATADYPRLFEVAHGVLSDRSLAEEVTQQALLDIWRDIRRLRLSLEVRGLGLSPARAGLLCRGEAPAEVDAQRRTLADR